MKMSSDTSESIVEALGGLDRHELGDLLSYLIGARKTLQPPLDAYLARLAALAAIELDDRVRGLGTLSDTAVIVLLRAMIAERQEATTPAVKKFWAFVTNEVDDAKRALIADRTPGNDPELKAQVDHMLPPQPPR